MVEFNEVKLTESGGIQGRVSIRSIRRADLSEESAQRVDEAIKEANFFKQTDPRPGPYMVADGQIFTLAVTKDGRTYSVSRPRPPSLPPWFSHVANLVYDLGTSVSPSTSVVSESAALSLLGVDLTMPVKELRQRLLSGVGRDIPSTVNPGAFDPIPPRFPVEARGDHRQPLSSENSTRQVVAAEAAIADEDSAGNEDGSGVQDSASDTLNLPFGLRSFESDDERRDEPAVGRLVSGRGRPRVSADADTSTILRRILPSVVKLRATRQMIEESLHRRIFSDRQNRKDVLTLGALMDAERSLYGLPPEPTITLEITASIAAHPRTTSKSTGLVAERATDHPFQPFGFSDGGGGGGGGVSGMPGGGAGVVAGDGDGGVDAGTPGASDGGRVPPDRVETTTTLEVTNEWNIGIWKGKTETKTEVKEYYDDVGGRRGGGRVPDDADGGRQ